MPQQQLRIDPLHSTIEFAVTFAMNTIIKGRFREFSGEILFDPADPETATATVRINAASVDSGAEERDDQLRGPDFFDAEDHADLTFESTEVEVIEDNHWLIQGDLIMAGTAMPVTLDTRYYGIVDDALGNRRAGFVAETDLLRSDWGMDWNAERSTGVLVSDRVRVSLYISAVPAANDESD